MEKFEEQFKEYRTQRFKTECPMCSDLYHGYMAGSLDQQAKIDKLEQENKDLKKAIAYSRQFYYLPQYVLDLFSVLLPSNEYDKEISGAFYNRVMEGSSGEV